MECAVPSPSRPSAPPAEQIPTAPPVPRARPERPPPPRSLNQPQTLPPPNRSNEDAEHKAKTVKIYHGEAYKFINQALTYDENGQKDQAMTLYQKGLEKLHKGIAVRCIEKGDVMDNTRKMQQKMRRSRTQIENRISELQTDFNVARAMSDPPPSYEQAISPGSYSLGDSIMNDEMSPGSNSLIADAHEIFSIPEGVQIYYITPEGHISAPSYPTSLKILKFTDTQPMSAGASNCTSERPPAFLQVGEWLYPLVPGSSPVLHASNGAYVFPDVMSVNPGTSVGLIFPETLSPHEKSTFERSLTNLTTLEEGPTATRVTNEEESMETEEGDRMSGKISKGIVTAAEWISWGLGKAAEKGTVLIQKGSSKAKDNIKPDGQPTPVPENVQTGLVYARKGTGVAVKVSSFLVDKLGQATMALAREAAPFLKQQGCKLLPQSLQPKEEGRSKIDDVAEVAVGGLQGFSTVFLGLERAAKDLAKGLADGTVAVVGHKYGEHVGQATENSLYSAGHIVMTGYNANHLGIKAIAKRAAKDTGKAVIQEFHEKKPRPPNPEN